MSGKTEGEGPKIINLNPDGSKAEASAPVMTEAEMIRQRKFAQKQASLELADYKKRIRASNEIKQLQVDEIRLGIEYYKYKVEFRELQPKMEELDALEAAEAKEAKEQHYDLVIIGATYGEGKRAHVPETNERVEI